MISRRDFTKAALAALPLSAAIGAPAVRVGVSTYSFRDLVRTPGRDNIDDVIAVLRKLSVTEIELHSANAEPAGPNSGPAVPPPPSAYPDPVRTPSPAQVAAAKLAVRNALRDWRLTTPTANFSQYRDKFRAAGIDVFAYRVDYDASFTDAEIDVTFQQAKAFGVARMASVMNMESARRVVPFAEKHGVTVAIHNSPSAIATPDQFRSALALSKNYRLNLDVGNLTAAKVEAVAFLQENHDAISHIEIKDRTRSGGSERFGDGDTPLEDVLKWVQAKQPTVPLFVEYDYIGLGTPEEEVRKCLGFVKSALRS